MIVQDLDLPMFLTRILVTLAQDRAEIRIEDCWAVVLKGNVSDVTNIRNILLMIGVDRCSKLIQYALYACNTAFKGARRLCRYR